MEANRIRNAFAHDLRIQITQDVTDRFVSAIPPEAWGFDQLEDGMQKLAEMLGPGQMVRIATASLFVFTLVMTGVDDHIIPGFS